MMRALLVAPLTLLALVWLYFGRINFLIFDEEQQLEEVDKPNTHHNNNRNPPPIISPEIESKYFKDSTPDDYSEVDDKTAVKAAAGGLNLDSYYSKINVFDYIPLLNTSIAKTIFEDRGEHLKMFEAAPGMRTSLLPHERNSGMHVITTFFRGAYQPRRFSEIVATLVANLENPHISFVHCLWEKENPAYYLREHPELIKKLIVVETKAQPSYAKMFTYANTALDRGSVAVVTNADIYFDSTLQCVTGPSPTAPVPPNHDRSVYALSRRPTILCGKTKADHNGILDLCLEYVHSHDAFIFAIPVPQEVVNRVNHMQNRYGAENIIIWEFAAAGFKVWNPCKKIRALHLHCSEERHYAETFIDGYTGGNKFRHGIVYPGTMRTGTFKWGGLVSLPFADCLSSIK